MNVEEIKEEIVKLEDSETNWTNIQRLAWLYAVHDHMMSSASDGHVVLSSSVKTMPEYSGEFGSVVSGKSIDGLMNVLSEHMSVVKVLYPKEYEAVLDKIKGIS